MKDRLGRRDFLKVSAVSMAGVFGGCSQQMSNTENEEPILRIGVVADIQYADRDPVPQYNSYYRPSIPKFEEFVDKMNSESLDFVIQLGDFADRDVKSYDKLLPIWNKLKVPKRSVIGNHDMEAAGSYPVVLEKLGLEKPYYDFVVKNWRFIVIDTNDIGVLGSKEGDPRREKALRYIELMEELGYPNARVWNSTVSDEQVEWVRSRLELANSNGESAIVFGHHTIVSNEPGLDIWNPGRLIKCFRDNESFKAYICGHHHEGSFVKINDDHYLTMNAMMSTPDTSAYSIMELYDDRIAVNGFGRQQDMVLPIK